MSTDFYLEKLNTQNLILGTLNYPSTDGVNGQVITTNGSGILNFTTQMGEAAKDYLIGRLDIIQNTDLLVGDHIKFDTVVASQGSCIFLDTVSPYTSGAGTSIGRFTLLGGKKYKIQIGLSVVILNNISSIAKFIIYNTTDGVVVSVYPINVLANAKPPGSINFTISSLITNTIVSPVSSKTYEMRISDLSAIGDVISINQVFIDIEVL